jgi:hypothetical protein
VSDVVVVRSYGSEIEAELGRATLETHGIRALVRRDDAAGLLRMVEGAKLIVHRDDAVLARRILDGDAPEPDEWEDE